MYFPLRNLLNQFQYVAKKNSEAANYFVYLQKENSYHSDASTPSRKSIYFGDFFEIIEPVVEGKKGTPKLNAEGLPVFQGRFYRATDLSVFVYRFNPENPPSTTSSALTPILLATEVNDDGVTEKNILRAFPYVVTTNIAKQLQDDQSSFKTQFLEKDGSQRTTSWGPAIIPQGGKFSWEKKDAINALALALTDYIRQESNQTAIIRSELSCYHVKDQPKKDKKPTCELLYNLTSLAIIEKLATFQTFNEVSVETHTISVQTNPDYKRVTYFKGLGSFGKTDNQVYLGLGFTASSLTEKEADVGLLAIEDNEVYFTAFDLSDSRREKWRSVLLCLMKNSYAKKWLEYIWKVMEQSPSPMRLPNVLMLGKKQSDCKLSTQSKSLLPSGIKRSVFVPTIKISPLAKEIFSRMKCHEVYVKKVALGNYKFLYNRQNSPRKKPTPQTPPQNDFEVAEIVKVNPQDLKQKSLDEYLALPERATKDEVERLSRIAGFAPFNYQVGDETYVIEPETRARSVQELSLPALSYVDIDLSFDKTDRLFDKFAFGGLIGGDPSGHKTTKVSLGVCIVLAGRESTYDAEMGTGNVKKLHPRIAASMLYAPNTMTEMVAKKDGKIVAASSDLLYCDVLQIALPSLEAVRKLFTFPVTVPQQDLWCNQPDTGRGWSKERMQNLDEETYNQWLYGSQPLELKTSYYGKRRRVKIFSGSLTVQMRNFGSGLEPVFVYVMLLERGAGASFMNAVKTKMKDVIPTNYMNKCFMLMESVIAVPAAKIGRVFPLYPRAAIDFNKMAKDIGKVIKKINSLRNSHRPKR